MDNPKDKIAVVYDYGLFLNFAEKLTEYFRKVYYYSPFKGTSPKINKYLVGSGLKVEMVSEWDRFVSDGIADIYIFPDIYTADIQYRLKNEGKLVWGCGDSEELETDRLLFKKELKREGLDVIPFSHYKGIDDVVDAIKEEEMKYIKSTYFRGDFETLRWRDKDFSMPEINRRSLGLGMYKNMIDFVVEDHVEGLEIGVDSYAVSGKTPETLSFGIEIKDCAYFSKVIKKNDLPNKLIATSDFMAKKMGEYNANGNFSTEVRTDGDKFYLLDGAFRMGNPPCSSIQEAISNWGDIIWNGAKGILVEPEWTCKYFCEILVHSNWVKDNPTQVMFPKEIEKLVKMRNYCKIDGKYYVAELGDEYNSVCSCVGIGDTFGDAIRNAINVAEKVDCIEKDAQVESIQDALSKIKTFKEYGLKPF